MAASSAAVGEEAGSAQSDQRLDCFYINLETATTRREKLERSFAEHGGARWRLQRFPAIDTDQVLARRIPGTLAPAAKACFLSHRHIISGGLPDERPIFIVEDDVVLGRHSCATIEHFLRTDSAPPWDIAFTDLCVPMLQTMIDLMSIRGRLAPGQVVLLDLAKLIFGGSAAYIVNGRSKRKFAALLHSAPSLDVPYDLFIRKLVHDGKIAALTFFPFVTSLSQHSDHSQIHSDDGGADLIWNTFRRFVWIDRDLDAEKAAMEAITAKFCDQEGSLFGSIVAAMLSKRYRSK